MFLNRLNSLKRLCNIIRHNVRQYSEIPDKDKPVKFSTSEAANWRAAYSWRTNPYDDTPHAQPLIISLSTGIFLYYFLWFREESDIDDSFDLNQSIFDRVEGLEETQLKLVRKNRLDRGEDVSDIDRRLKELGVEIETET